MITKKIICIGLICILFFAGTISVLATAKEQGSNKVFFNSVEKKNSDFSQSTLQYKIYIFGGFKLNIWIIPMNLTVDKSSVNIKYVLNNLKGETIFEGQDDFYVKIIRPKTWFYSYRGYQNKGFGKINVSITVEDQQINKTGIFFNNLIIGFK